MGFRYSPNGVCDGVGATVRLRRSDTAGVKLRSSSLRTDILMRWGSRVRSASRYSLVTLRWANEGKFKEVASNYPDS